MWLLVCIAIPCWLGLQLDSKDHAGLEFVQSAWFSSALKFAKPSEPALKCQGQLGAAQASSLPSQPMATQASSLPSQPVATQPSSLPSQQGSAQPPQNDSNQGNAADVGDGSNDGGKGRGDRKPKPKPASKAAANSGKKKEPSRHDYTCEKRHVMVTHVRNDAIQVGRQC